MELDNTQAQETQDVAQTQSPKTYTQDEINGIVQERLSRERKKYEDYDSLKQLPIALKFKRIDHKNGIAPYFREWLRTTMTAKKPEPQNYWSRELYVRDSTLWETSALYGWCNKNEKSPSSSPEIIETGIFFNKLLSLR